MRNYRVIVNGVEYDIAIEQVEAGPVKAAAQQEPQAAPAAKPQAQPQAQAAQGGEDVKAPMPGSILSLNVKEGDQVKRGQVLLILEAMKMENEILAPKDGEVAALSVQAGQSVETGSLLCTLV